MSSDGHRPLQMEMVLTFDPFILFVVDSLQVDAHEDDVNAVSFADDSSHILYSGSDDGLCKVRRFLSIAARRELPRNSLHALTSVSIMLVAIIITIEMMIRLATDLLDGQDGK